MYISALCKTDADEYQCVVSEQMLSSPMKIAGVGLCVWRVCVCDGKPSECWRIGRQYGISKALECHLFLPCCSPSVQAAIRILCARPSQR